MNEYFTMSMEFNNSTKPTSWWQHPSLLLLLSSLLFSSILMLGSGIYNGAITGKYFYFNQIFEVALGLWLLVLVLFQKEHTGFAINKAGVCLLGLLAYWLLDFWLRPGTFEPRWASTLLLVVWVFWVQAFRAKEAVLCVVLWLFASIESIWGGIVYFRHFRGWQHTSAPEGSLYNSGLWGLFMVAPLLLCLVIPRPSETQLERFRWQFFQGLRYVAGLCSALGLALSQSRTAWGAVCIGLCCYLGLRYAWGQKLRRTSKLVQLSSLGLCLGLLGCGGWWLYHFKENSANGRLLIWKIACRMLDQPLFGKGFASFERSYLYYQAQYFAHGGNSSERWVAGSVVYAFQDYLQWMIEYGLVGFILLIGLWYCLLRLTNKRYLPVLLACLVCGFSSYPNESLATSLQLYTVFALAFGTVATSWQQPMPRLLDKLVKLVLVLSLGGLWQANREYMTTQKASRVAERNFDAGRYQEAVALYARLYPQLKKDGSSLQVYGKALALIGKHAQAIVVYEQASKTVADPFLFNNLGISYQAVGRYEEAAQSFLLSHHMIPNLIYPQSLLAKLYLQQGKVAQAKKVAKEVLACPVKVYSEAADEMKIEMRNLLENKPLDTGLIEEIEY